MQLCAAGAAVTALDSSSMRMKRVEENLHRTGMLASASIVVADALLWQPQAGQKFDAIVLDAPCSATGTIRRHPELPWQRTESDIKRLVELQQRLLSRAVEWITPNGELLYIVCSLLAEEGEQQIQQLLSQEKRLEIVPIEAESVPVTAPLAINRFFITKEGFLRTTPAMLPKHGGMDGFFVARLRRKG